jgi:hypothetical protein
VKNNCSLQMEKVNLIKMFLFLVISKPNINFLRCTTETNVLWFLINNVTITSKGDRYLKAQNYTIINKGYWWNYSSLPSTFAQQIIKCSICIERGKFLSFPFLCITQCFFQNLHIKHQIKPNVHLIINYIKNIMKNIK